MKTETHTHDRKWHLLPFLPKTHSKILPSVNLHDNIFLPYITLEIYIRTAYLGNKCILCDMIYLKEVTLARAHVTSASMILIQLVITVQTV